MGLSMTDDIARRTRQSIADFFTATETPWSGDLPEEDFLARLYDLSAMESRRHSLPYRRGRHPPAPQQLDRLAHRLGFF